MAKAQLDTIYDSGSLAYLRERVTRLTVCSAQPASYAQANSTTGVMLAKSNVLTSTDFTLADGSTDGRKITLAAQNGITVSKTGTMTHGAWIGSSGSVLYATTLITSAALTSGHGVNVPAHFFEIGDVVGSYASVLRDTYNASEIWPLVDISSGTNIPAFINGNRDGTLTGWALQNAAGPVTGTLAPLSDGSNDYGNIFTDNGTDGLEDVWDGAAGSTFAWAKVSASGVWTDSTNRGLIWLRDNVGNTDNLVAVRKATANNTLDFFYRANEVTETHSEGSVSTTDWFSVGVSWDKTADEVKFFLNGSQVGSTQTGLNVWSGTLETALIGATSTTPTAVWDGWTAYHAVKLGSVWSPTDFSNMHAAASTSGAD